MPHGLEDYSMRTILCGNRQVSVKSTKAAVGPSPSTVANAGMDIIDCGPPILGMHSPLELCAKDDVWMTHRAFKVFLES